MAESEARKYIDFLQSDEARKRLRFYIAGYLTRCQQMTDPHGSACHLAQECLAIVAQAYREQQERLDKTSAKIHTPSR